MALKGKGTWDKGVKFEHILERLRTLLHSKGKAKCYAQIYLIQLKNALQISEAVRAWKRFMETGEHHVMVQLSRHKEDEKRKVIIPHEVVRDEACYSLAALDENTLKLRAISYIRKREGLNTHTLRYATAMYLLRTGMSFTDVSEVLGHKSHYHLMRHIQKKITDEVIEELTKL